MDVQWYFIVMVFVGICLFAIFAGKFISAREHDRCRKFFLEATQACEEGKFHLAHELMFKFNAQLLLNDIRDTETFLGISGRDILVLTAKISLALEADNENEKKAPS